MKYDHTCVPRNAGIQEVAFAPRKAEIWNRLAEKYARSPVADPESYETKLALTREYFTPDSHVLELACGTGTTAIHHAPFVRSIRGVDISSGMIRIARRKLAETSISNVSFEVDDIETMVLENDAYDVVMAHSILHLVSDRQRVLDRMMRLVRPGGYIVTSTMCLSDALRFRLMSPVFGLLRFFGLPKVSPFTSDQLQHEIETSGFQTVHRWQPSADKAAFFIAKRPD